MREIKFRAWIDNKIKPITFLIFTKKGCFLKFPLMQYTGVKSKSGVEIYGGDIVKKYLKSNPKTMNFEVKWDSNQCGFNISKGNNHWYEVIGNIYENPKLIQND